MIKVGRHKIKTQKLLFYNKFMVQSTMPRLIPGHICLADVADSVPLDLSRADISNTH